jgi:hypothetical protein
MDEPYTPGDLSTLVLLAGVAALNEDLGDLVAFAL